MRGRCKRGVTVPGRKARPAVTEQSEDGHPETHAGRRPAREEQVNAMTERSMTGSTTSSGGSQDRLQQAASDIVDRTTEKVGSRVDDQASSQLQRAGDVLGSVAEAVRQSGDQLRDQQPQIADVASTAASQIERVAGHIRESRPRDLLQDVEQFARQQPAVFLGGALLIGAVAARVLKASPQAGNGMRAGYGGSEYGYGGSGYGSGSTGTRYGTTGTGYGSAGTGYGTGSYGSMGSTAGTADDGRIQG
jgi:hypothetical protein